MEIKPRQTFRKVVVENFFGQGDHLYEDQLGWQRYEREEARSNVSKEIFNFEVVLVGLNIWFYYVDNDTFYVIFGELTNIELHECLRDRDEKFLYDQFVETDWYQGKKLQVFNKREDVWSGVSIDGKKLGEVLSRSFIINLN